MTYGFCYDEVGNRCTGRTEPGARALGDFCKDRWALPLVGIYNCRDTVFGTPSVHGEGRADDLHVHLRDVEDPPRGDERAKGDAMWDFLIDCAPDLGVQQVIWLDKDWNSITREVTDYGGLFHGNHVHVELCWAAARRLDRPTIDRVAAAYYRENTDMPTLVNVTAGPDKGKWFVLIGDVRSYIADLAELTEWQEAGVPTLSLGERAWSRVAGIGAYDKTPMTALDMPGLRSLPQPQAGWLKATHDAVVNGGVDAPT